MQFIKAHYLTDISQAQSLLVRIADENYSNQWCVYQPKASGPIRWPFLNELPTVFKSKLRIPTKAAASDLFQRQGEALSVL